MTLANANPATLAACRAGNEAINGFEPFDAFDLTAVPARPQVATIIASKFNLDPVLARIVCDLAGIGMEASI